MPPKVVFPNCRTIEREYFKYEWTVEVHSASASPIANDQMYQGTVCISGYLKKMHNAVVVLQGPRNLKFVEYPDRSIYRANPGDYYYLLLGYAFEKFPKGGIQLNYLQGLLLESTGRCQDEYYRVGMFYHDWLQERRGCGNWPAFIDFDPTNYLDTRSPL